MDRAKEIRKVLVVVLMLNWLVAAAKLLVGYFTKSNSMVADGFHSFADGSSNIIGLAGIWFASQPVDEKHPYGHKKYETFTAVGIAILLLLLSFNVFRDSIDRLRHPLTPSVDLLSFIVMGITIAVNFVVVSYEYAKGKKMHSDILISDSMHTRGDILTSFSVVFALIAVKLGYPVLDTVVSGVIALLIIHSAYEILRDASQVLCDTSVIDKNKIEVLVNTVKGVSHCHKIRTRGRCDDVHVDLHVVVDPAMPIQEAHELSEQIESVIKREFSGVTDIVVHIEPVKCRE
ncbi:MAG: cation diffusion facilitator family transporter [Candidatus Omnitrophica bacterium]|nr:cation diffusion facilitator family transporter [Candidatus Omnitrophota bacterium]MDD5654710.1 cation diffusion facilitator family transporter [Candidatus Omnitrophota bacterium]